MLNVTDEEVSQAPVSVCTCDATKKPNKKISNQASEGKSQKNKTMVLLHKMQKYDTKHYKQILAD